MATLEEIARQVLAGQYGNGADRKTNLTNAGYDYNTVQGAVNTLMGGGVLSNGGMTLGNSIGQATAPTADPIQGYRNNISSLTNQISGLKNENYASKYANQINDLSNQLNNRQFTYNPEQDEVYKQYQKDYTDYGKKAMEDTLGSVSARTGGLASSYAISASEQAYNNYMQQLASKIPELRQLALDMFNNETDDITRKLNNYKDLDKTDYERWADSQKTEETRLRNNLSMYQNLLDSALAEQAKAQAQAKVSSGGGGGGNPVSPTSTPTKALTIFDRIGENVISNALSGTPYSSGTDYNITNQNDSQGVYVGGIGKVSWSELQNLLNQGKVEYKTDSNGKTMIYNTSLKSVLSKR